MTASEAVKWIEALRDDEGIQEYIYADEFIVALNIAINAVIRTEVSKKIVYQKQSYGTPYRCPECEADQTPIDFFNSDGTEPNEKYSWCWHCGQKLDWSDTK